MKRSQTVRSRSTQGVLVGLATVGMAACGSGGAAGGDETLQFFLSGDANQGGGFAHMAEKYEAETGVTVEIVDIANADLPTKLKNAAQANDLPALARVGGIDPIWKDATVDLAPVTDASAIRTDLAAVDPDGKVLSVPTDITAVGMFVNATLFDEAGVGYPDGVDDVWTWDEYVAAVKEVQAATDTSYGMVMDQSSHRLKAFLYEFGSEYFRADANGQFSTGDETRAALEYFADLNDDVFMPRSVWLSGDDPNALFKSGDVVSYMSGSWQIADFADNIADFEWASVPLPAQPVQATNFGNAANIVVFDGTGQEQAALDFVTWLYEPENYQELSETAGFLPAVDGIDVTYASHADAFELYNQEIAAAPPIVGEIKSEELAYEIQGAATNGDPVRDETIKYLNGEQDVDQTIQRINEQLSDQLGALE
jgi:alpha-1,4-digalacturonate transport system substrate-binding protein